MTKRQPKLLNFFRIREILEPHIAQVREHFFLSQQMAIIRASRRPFQLVMQQQPPFAIDDYRFALIVGGSARVIINLVEKKLEAGMIAFLGPGSIITPVETSDDLEVYGMALFSQFQMPFSQGQLPSAFNGQVRDFQIRVGEGDCNTVRNIIETLWQVVHQPHCNQQTVGSLVAALMYQYDGLYQQHTPLLQSARTREQNTFDRFIALVNRYAAKEHHLAFYASKMCLTERYLGTVVRQASGVTAKEWIDKALITRIKIKLRHSDDTIAQIADDMHFPNPSFFSKYFKRLTGCTPLEYREGKG